MHPLHEIIGLVFLGATIGYASGLFGVGGGFMMTPLLISLFKIEPALAVGSGLAQMIVVGAGAGWRHARAGFVDLCLIAYMAPGAVLGTAVGKGIMRELERSGSIVFAGHRQPIVLLVINGLFVVLLLSIALRLWKQNTANTSEAGGSLCWPNGPCPVSLPASGITAVSRVSLVCAGLLLGVLTGLLGVGGGVILIPLLLCGYGVPMRLAIGTSSLMVLISALAGTVQYAVVGKVDLWLVLALVAGAIPSVHVGVWHSHRLPVTRLQRVFALLVIIVAGIALGHLIWH